MAGVMVSVTIMVLYVGFLTVAGGGEAIEATIPEEFKGESPFEEGGFFNTLGALVDVLVGLLKLAWNVVKLLASIVTFDLETFGLPPATGLLRLVLGSAITLMTIHILWETVSMLRGAT